MDRPRLTADDNRNCDRVGRRLGVDAPDVDPAVSNQRHGSHGVRGECAALYRRGCAGELPARETSYADRSD